MLSLNWIIGIIVFLLIGWAFLSHRIKKHQRAREIKDVVSKEQELWQQKHQMSYGQIQNKKFSLIEYVRESILEDTAERRQLLHLIDEWAELQVQSFEDRRSWVRKPAKNQTESK